jgi:hypothetical protein
MTDQLGPLLYFVDAGRSASSLSFSSASGIIRPNIELSMAIGMTPPLPPSCAGPPDIRKLRHGELIDLPECIGEARKILLGEAVFGTTVRVHGELG